MAGVSPSIVLRVWTLCLAVFIIAPCVVGQPATEAPQSVHLEFQQRTPVTGYWRINTDRHAPFTKEPSTGIVVRGTLRWGFGDPQDTNNGVPFFWASENRQLTFDLNRNDDLTDDTVYSTTNKERYYQTFTNVIVNFKAGPEIHPVGLEVLIYQNNSSRIVALNGLLYINSFWQGKVLLQGKEWQIGLIENPCRPGPTVDRLLVLRPWADRDKPFSVDSGAPVAFPFTHNLFLNDRAYQLNYAYEDGATPRFRLEITPQSAELGEVSLTGKSIRRLVLTDHDSPTPFTAVYDSPSARVKTPPGTFRRYAVWLKEGTDEAFAGIRRDQSTPAITVTTTNVTVVNAGGPLTNSLAIQEVGSETLALTYHAVGGDQLVYTVPRWKAGFTPSFRVQANQHDLGSSNFEFG